MPGEELAIIYSQIHLIRGKRVILDRDIARLYGVPTGAVNRAVRRNPGRFPSDFRFQLGEKEWADLKCQIGISSWGGDRGLPNAFTEQGVAMLSGVLNSARAVAANVAIMRAFVKLRETLATNKQLGEKFKELEAKVENQGEDIRSLFAAIRALMDHSDEKRSKIGFTP